jgi:hypothetical protein
VEIEADRSQTGPILQFPEELKVADAAVNRLVLEAMSACAEKRYDDFRAAWSPREDPMSRDEFEQSWHAVREIRLRALKPAMFESASEGGRPDRQRVYVAYAEVLLDPEHRAGEREPLREAVLMLIQEQGQWRLARAPKAMRAWIREQVHPRTHAFVGPPAPPFDGKDP